MLFKQPMLLGISERGFPVKLSSSNFRSLPISIVRFEMRLLPKKSFSKFVSVPISSGSVESKFPVILGQHVIQTIHVEFYQMTKSSYVARNRLDLISVEIQNL